MRQRVTRFDGHISNPISLEHVFFCERRGRAADKEKNRVRNNVAHQSSRFTYLILYSATLFSSGISFPLFCAALLLLCYSWNFKQQCCWIAYETWWSKHKKSVFSCFKHYRFETKVSPFYLIFITVKHKVLLENEKKIKVLLYHVELKRVVLASSLCLLILSIDTYSL